VSSKTCLERAAIFRSNINLYREFKEKCRQLRAEEKAAAEAAAIEKKRAALKDRALRTIVKLEEAFKNQLARAKKQNNIESFQAANRSLHKFCNYITKKIPDPYGEVSEPRTWFEVCDGPQGECIGDPIGEKASEMKNSLTVALEARCTEKQLWACKDSFDLEEVPECGGY